MSIIDGITQPRAFISYSWSNEQHQAWVLQLAERLVSDGVDIILDKWDLQVGHDAIAFMEKIVTDPAVTKVLLVCDRIYTDKADGRLGGVGKEAQILTPEIYAKAEQNKYAALITEKDDDGRAYTPAYYGGRQFIDFTEEDRAESSYESLLRWIYDRPLYVKPKLGRAPAFIVSPSAVATLTTSRYKRAEQAIRSASPSARGFLAEFGDTLVDEFKGLTPDISASPFDDEVVRAANAMRTGLRHLNDLVMMVVRFSDSNFDVILDIFERMGQLMYPTEDMRGWREDQFDPYRMMCFEGFLSMTAILISERRFDMLHTAVSRPYYFDQRYSGSDIEMSFVGFWKGLPSFEVRKQRLSLNQVDVYVDFLKEIYQISFPKFENIIEAEIILYLISIFTGADRYSVWWPRTVVLARRHKALPLFARSVSLTFFKSWAAKLLGSITVPEFKSKISEHSDDFRHLGYLIASIESLTNSQHLGTQP